MEDFANISFDIKSQPVPSRRAPLPPTKAQMSKQPSNQSRYNILSAKLFQPNLRRQNVVKKKSAPPRPPPPSLNNLIYSQTVSSFRAAKNFKCSKLNSQNVHSNNLKASLSEACLIDFSSPPNSPYAGSGSDGVSINSFGSENSSNTQSASEDIFDPFGLICEEPQNVGFYNKNRTSINKAVVKNWDDDDPFEEIALRHAKSVNNRPQPMVHSSTGSVKSSNVICKAFQPTQSNKSTFYTKEDSSKPLRTTIIRPKNPVKLAPSSSALQTSKSESTLTGKEINKVDIQIAESLYDFVASETGDLNLQVGQNVQILRRVNADWLYGKTSLGEGMFPDTFVKIISPEPEKSTLATQNTPEDQSKAFVKALYTFSGEVDSDLSVQEGETICILGRINDDWLYGEVRGLRGQFPATFVENVPSNLPKWGSYS